MMQQKITILIMLVCLGISCILEPYEITEETGVCYRGYELYRQLQQDEDVRIDIITDLPDTIKIEKVEEEMEFTFIYHIDTAFFSCGNYAIEFWYRPSIQGYSYNMDIDTLSFSTELQFQNAWMRTEIQSNTVNSISDTFRAKISYQLDEGKYFIATYDTAYDTATIWLEFYRKRYVDGSYCSNESIFTTKPITVIIQRPYE